MNLNEDNRELLERALDTLIQRIYEGTPPPISEIRLYERAVSLVRDLPPGVRRIRSDFQTKRPTAQTEIPIE